MSSLPTMVVHVCIAVVVVFFIGFDIRRRIDMFKHDKIVEILWLSLYLPIF